MTFWGWVATVVGVWCVAAVAVSAVWCIVCNRISPRQTRWDAERGE